jgi:DNA-directed RNA polymerase subunit RPC12/RpoP
MAYHCSDCSYLGDKSSASGRCPACGSSNFSNTREGQKNGEAQASSPLKLAALIALWSYLIIEIYRKLYH